MPYPNPRQPKAIFLNIKRRKGLEAAKRFGEKHREDFQSPAMKKPKVKKPYRSRYFRSSNGRSSG